MALHTVVLPDAVPPQTPIKKGVVDPFPEEAGCETGLHFNIKGVVLMWEWRMDKFRGAGAEEEC